MRVHSFSKEIIIAPKCKNAVTISNREEKKKKSLFFPQKAYSLDLFLGYLLDNIVEIVLKASLVFLGGVCVRFEKFLKKLR